MKYITQIFNKYNNEKIIAWQQQVVESLQHRLELFDSTNFEPKNHIEEVLHCFMRQNIIARFELHKSGINHKEIPDFNEPALVEVLTGLGLSESEIKDFINGFKLDLSVIEPESIPFMADYINRHTLNKNELY